MTARTETGHNRGERQRIGQQIRTARQSVGMSQYDLADIAGAPQGLVSYVETATRDPLLSSVIDLAGAAGRRVALVGEHHLPLLNLTADEIDTVLQVLTLVREGFGPETRARIDSALDKLTTTEETGTDGS